MPVLPRVALRANPASVTVPISRRRPLLSVVIVALALFIAACGGATETATETGTNIVDAGSFKVELPDEIIEVEEAEPEEADTTQAPGTENADAETETEPEEPAETEPAETEPTPDAEAIPLDTEVNPVTALFESFEDFQTCLERLGSQFLGIPDPEIPETMAPEYLADLQTCASESGILEAQSNLDAASADRTLEETEQWNEGVLLFGDCLRGRGWTVAEPQMDAYGSLQVGGAADGGAGFEPPPGEELVDNPTLRECAADAQRAVDDAAAENG